MMRNLNIHLSWDDYNEGVIHGADWTLSDALALTAAVLRLAGSTALLAQLSIHD